MDDVLLTETQIQGILDKYPLSYKRNGVPNSAKDIIGISKTRNKAITEAQHAKTLTKIKGAGLTDADFFRISGKQIYERFTIQDVVKAFKQVIAG